MVKLGGGGGAKNKRVKRAIEEAKEAAKESVVLCDVVDVNYSVPSQRNESPRGDKSKGKILVSIFFTILQEIENTEKRMVRVKQRLGMLKQSYL